MDVRPYQSSDRDACLALFDSNVPRFFAALERGGFESFLDAPDCSYFVMEHEGAVLGCGGESQGTDGARGAHLGEGWVGVLALGVVPRALLFLCWAGGAEGRR